jgi:hypothetical protein
MPYALLGILTAGTAIGAGLSLSNGPNTVTYYPAPTLTAAYKTCALEMASLVRPSAIRPSAIRPSAIRSEYQRATLGFVRCMGNEGFIIGSRDGRQRWVSIS